MYKRTLIIHSTFEEFPVVFLVDGDYSHLHETCVNTGENDEARHAELTKLLYADKKDQYGNGYWVHRVLPLDEWRAETNSAVAVILTGFAP